ncbi:hypothetical protein [Sorangium sp. So ce362]|uniref:hypothetical protein n=1 Tax=Sorangium sp. So ce362 TaxID=3133303 RepID=UPI003F5DA77B
MGGIGSGNVAALAVAAERLGRRVHAHLFWTDPSRSVIDNLAFIASGPTSIRFYPSRLELALARPSLFLPLRARDGDGAAIVPLGATSALGMVGVVRAALESTPARPWPRSWPTRGVGGSARCCSGRPRGASPCPAHPASASGSRRRCRGGSTPTVAAALDKKPTYLPARLRWTGRCRVVTILWFDPL